MAGCFGNHPVDRWLEGQLYRYLEECDDYEAMCEKISAKIPDDLWNKYDNFINKIIDKYLAVRVERRIMTMDEAQNLLLKFVTVIDANKKYLKR